MYKKVKKIGLGFQFTFILQGQKERLQINELFLRCRT